MAVMPTMPVPMMEPMRSRTDSGSWAGSRPASRSASSVASSAHIVNRSSLRWSGTLKCCSGSHWTEAANLTGWSFGSKRVIGPTPFSPRRIRDQLVSTSLPRALIMPRPVITTRLCSDMGAGTRQRAPVARTLPGASGLGGDVLDRVADRLDLLRVLVRDRDLELVLELHHELDLVERIGPEVVDEGGLARDLVGRGAHAVAHDLDHAFFNRRVAHLSLLVLELGFRGSVRFGSTRCALEAHAAVDDQRLAGDVGAARSGQVLDSGCDLLRSAEAAQGDGLEQFRARGLVEGRGHVGRDEARRDGVDAHPAAGELLGDRLRQPDQAGLAGGVVRLAGVARETHDRGDVDHAPLGLHQRPAGGLEEVPGALEVDLEHAVEVLLAHAHQELGARDPGVVDQDVEAAELLLDLLDQLGHTLGLPHPSAVGR